MTSLSVPNKKISKAQSLENNAHHEEQYGIERRSMSDSNNNVHHHETSNLPSTISESNGVFSGHHGIVLTMKILNDLLVTG
jgi:hypothetical protein